MLDVLCKCESKGKVNFLGFVFYDDRAAIEQVANCPNQMVEPHRRSSVTVDSATKSHIVPIAKLSLIFWPIKIKQNFENKKKVSSLLIISSSLHF